MPTYLKIGKKVLLILFLVFIGILLGWLHFLFSPIVTDQNGLKYTVRSGASIGSVIHDLSTEDILTHPELFKILVRLAGDSKQLKAGEYFFPKGTTPIRLLHQITTGEGIYYHTFTIIAGWNFKQIQKVLADKTDIQHKIETLTDTDIMKEMGSDYSSPEGLFYPDTYYFSSGATDLSLLKRAYQKMQEKLNTAWENRDATTPWQSLYEALIAASLIEKEAQLNIERPRIAGVIVNRLNKNMLLQIDPTVIYGMGDRYNGVIHKSDLIENTPYNTYVHKGLPPTPIAMPSMDSIQAAMHPEKHDFYYFVAAGGGESNHNFSATLEQHNLAVSDARKSHEWYFNSNIVRYYLLKILSS